MALNVLNRPDNEWYRRWLHVKIPRMAESRQYLDPVYTLAGGVTAVPGGYAAGLLNQQGRSTTVRYGCVVADATEKPYGGFTPALVKGVPLMRWATDNTGLCTLRFGTVATGGVQLPPAIATLNLTIEGYGALALPWLVGQLAYRATVPAFWTFLSTPANVDKVLGVNGMPTNFVLLAVGENPAALGYDFGDGLGAITPDRLESHPALLRTFSVNPSNGRLRIRLAGGVQLPGVSTIAVTTPFGETFPAAWNASQGRYVGPAPGLLAYLQAHVDEVVELGVAFN